MVSYTHGQMGLGTLRAREHMWVALQRAGHTMDGCRGAVPPERKEPKLWASYGDQKMQGVEGSVTSLVVTSAWRKLPAHLDPESFPRKVQDTRGSGLNHRMESLKQGEGRGASNTLQEPFPATQHLPGE